MRRNVAIAASLTCLLGYSRGLTVREDCGAVYDQCGGLLFTGAKCCQAPLVCVKQNDYYSQCLSPGDASTMTTSQTTGTPTPTVAPTTISTPYRTSTTFLTGTAAAAHTQLPYPDTGEGCTADRYIDGVCCPYYCANDLRSESCNTATCQGACTNPDPAVCKSGTMFPEVTEIKDDEQKWHYSRSTHYGTTSAGACGFGLYAMCAKSNDAKVTEMLGDACDAFCTAYPALCQDPTGTNVTLRGNFAAPNGDYYTQFWSSLPGDRDNYLSCGECFEVVRTKNDGTDYQPGEAGYTAPIVLEITDSCPCQANAKWCCGPGFDRCGEVAGLFKYGCPLPEDSIHLDLGDVAMTRLQGTMTDGVIPTRYRRVNCPSIGNVYVWLRSNSGPYYFQLTAVNAAGTGSVVNIEVRGNGQAEWVPMQQLKDYLTSRPQERYGAWVPPSDKTPFQPPLGIRLTSATGEQIVNELLIPSFAQPDWAPSGNWFLDMGIQFQDGVD